MFTYLASFFKKNVYKTEYTKIERELFFKRLKLTDLFIKVCADKSRSIFCDRELELLEWDVRYLNKRYIMLDKLVYGKKSKYICEK